MFLDLALVEGELCPEFRVLCLQLSRSSSDDFRQDILWLDYHLDDLWFHLRFNSIRFYIRMSDILLEYEP